MRSDAPGPPALSEVEGAEGEPKEDAEGAEGAADGCASAGHEIASPVVEVPRRIREPSLLEGASTAAGWNVPASVRRRLVEKLTQYLEDGDDGMRLQRVARALVGMDKCDLERRRLAMDEDQERVSVKLIVDRASSAREVAASFFREQLRRD